MPSDKKVRNYSLLYDSETEIGVLGGVSVLFVL